MDREKIISELTFKAVRSSGPGGQNVNKVASKVVLSFDVMKSEGLEEFEKLMLQTKLVSRLTNESVLVLHCDENRSQIKNKEIVIKRFLAMIKNALHVAKARKATKVPKAVVKKRIKDKKTAATIKFLRKKPNLE